MALATLLINTVYKWCQTEAYEQHLLSNTLVLCSLNQKVINVCSKIHKQQPNSLAYGIKCKKHGTNIAKLWQPFFISQQEKVIGDFAHHH